MPKTDLPKARQSSRIAFCTKGRWQAVLNLVSFSLLIALLISLYGLTVEPSQKVWGFLETQNFNLQLLVAGLGCYLLNHAIRAFRLFLILLEHNRSLRCLTSLHLSNAAASILLPFKTGDLLRISELTNLTKSAKTSFSAVLLERFFDAIILSAFIGALGFLSVREDGYQMLAITLFLGLAVGAFLFISLPHFLNFLRQIAVQKSQSKRSLKLLRLLNPLQDFHQLIVSMLKNRGILCFGLSCVIWALELAAISLIFQSFSGADENPILLLLQLLDSLLLQNSWATDTAAIKMLLLVIIAIPFNLFYLFWRLNNAKQAWQKLHAPKPYQLQQTDRQLYQPDRDLI